MKLSISSVFLSVLLASLASAGPIQPRAETKQMSPAQGQAVGAAYFITNDPSGNFVVASDIGSTGKLTLREAISAGGLGLHGITSPNGPDGLFSQGSIKASATGNIVATVNPGSNTIAVFSINPANPSSLTMIGDPVGSGGEFPMSLAINKAGNTVCALNGGAINGVNCFKVDKTAGLISMANTNRPLGLNQTTPANGPAGSASHIIFTEDGNQLVASVKGIPPTPGFLAVWDIAADGSLSQDFQSVAPASGGLLPFSMTVIPGQNAILATDAGLGFDLFDFSALNSSSARNSAVPIAGQGATCWSSHSTQTGNFYLTDIKTSMITEVNVNNNLNGTIVKQYPQSNASHTIDNDIASVGKKDFLYVLSPGVAAINVLSLNAPGAATSLQTVDIAGPAKKAGLTINNNNLQGMTTFIKSA